MKSNQNSYNLVIILVIGLLISIGQVWHNKIYWQLEMLINCILAILLIAFADAILITLLFAPFRYLNRLRKRKNE